MSGLIVLFWFVAQGVALRYFVSSVIGPPIYIQRLTAIAGPLHRCHVLPIRGLGCDRYFMPLHIIFYGSDPPYRRHGRAQGKFLGRIRVCPCLRLLSVPRFAHSKYPPSALTNSTGRAVWGIIWTFIAICFFAAGIIVGLVAFKQSAAQQKEDASHFLPVPHSHSGTTSIAGIPSLLSMGALLLVSVIFEI